MSYPKFQKKPSKRRYEYVSREEHKRSLFRNCARRDPAFLTDRLLRIPLEPFHLRWFEFSKLRRRSLILAPRGHGKSTALTVGYTIWLLLRDPNVRVLIVSNTQSQASAFLREIKQRLESPQIVALFGDQRGSKWAETEIIVAPCKRLSKEATVTSLGVEGAIISRHFDAIILDDVVDQENARTETQREKLKEWLYVTLLPTLEPHGELRVIGTRYHLRDLYSHLAEGPLAQHLICDRALGPGDIPLWPSRYSADWLKQRRAEAGPVIFNAQYQNDVELMRGKLFHGEWFRHYSTLPRKLRVAIGIDPAIGRDDHHDYFAACAVGADDVGNFYVLESFRGRFTFEEQVRQVIAMYERHNLPERAVTRVGIEATAYQEALPQRIQLCSRIPVVSIRPAVDKVSRAYALTAFFESGRIFFPAGPGCDSLVEELLLFPEGEHDDLFDALEMAVNLAAQTSSWRDIMPRRSPEVAPVLV